MREFNPEEELNERISWFVGLRWLAVAGVFLTGFFASRILGFSLPVFNLYIIASILAAYNLIFLLLLSTHKNSLSLKTLNTIANSQISLDLLSLAFLVHFSGGIENPFIFYFIFHMIIAGTLLSRRSTYLQATFAVGLFCLLVILEYFAILPHYCLKGFIGSDLHRNNLYIFGISFVFISALYISAYMATSISARLRQRERVLKEINELLKEKDKVKSEYVLRVSHDIKEHLAAIQGCLEPVAAGITGELNTKQLDLVKRAVDRTAKLIFFVKALLEITRMKLSRAIKMEYFSFADMLSEAINHVWSKARDKNIAISSVVEPSITRIRGAKEYLQETIINLLANSLKYTHRNGKVGVVVTDKGNYILIEVSDNGIGIPQKELPKIFEEFYRASNAKQIERDGTGLGLSIAKQIVQMHNGKIWVESEEGKGSVFSIELPK